MRFMIADAEHEHLLADFALPHSIVYKNFDMTHLDVTLRRAFLSRIDLLVLEVHLPDVAIDAGVEVAQPITCRVAENILTHIISPQSPLAPTTPTPSPSIRSMQLDACWWNLVVIETG